MHVVLIPSYEPDHRLVDTVGALVARHPDRPVLVVDDGSGERYRAVFDEARRAGAAVIAHSINRGKGAALKTGFAAIAHRRPGADVITADGDGQHTPRDIERVAEAVRRRTAGCEERTLVLGAREFDGDVPTRSRLGNVMTRRLFRLATGTRLADTQTGLRGLPASILPWAQSVAGSRFDYEFRMLLTARSAGVSLIEIPIETVYTPGNTSSHFRPLADSARIYAPLLRFAASALLAFLIDTVTLLALYAATGWLFGAVVGARVVSAGVNFAVNRRLVFDRGRAVPVRAAALRYFSLAALLLAANFGVITALTDAGVPLLLAKLVTEVALFLFSFSVQRSLVFAPSAARDAMPAIARAAETPTDANLYGVGGRR